MSSALSADAEELSSFLAALSRTLDGVAARVRHVDAELRYLDALRLNLTGGSTVAAHPYRRTAVLPCSRKRSRESEAPVLQLSSHRGFPKEYAEGRAADPFRDAGLYTQHNNRIVQYAPLPPSRDESTWQQIQLLFPSSPPRGRPLLDGLPATAASRVHAALRAAGIPESNCAVEPHLAHSTFVREARSLAKHELKNVHTVLDQRMVRAACLDLFGDPTSLYDHLATCFVKSAMPGMPRSQHLRLLSLVNTRRKGLGKARLTYAHCRECADRDLLENTHVQWLHTLLCVAPPRRSGRPPSLLYVALCWYFLKATSAPSGSVAHLEYVLSACGGFPEMLSQTKLHHSSTSLAARTAASAAYEDGTKALFHL